jgi:hypothetical protein
MNSAEETTTIIELEIITGHWKKACIQIVRISVS